MYCFIMASTVSPVILVKCQDWRVILGQSAVSLTNNNEPLLKSQERVRQVL
ncbi:MAG: hypothetical protein Tsb0014_31300 [Pleurocapsa sp.]